MLKNLLFILCFTSSFVFSQNIKEPVNNAVVFEKALKKYKEGNFAEALKEMERIDRNDTLYADALLQRSIINLALENYEEGIRVCKEGLLLESPNDHNFYINQGVILNTSKKREEALSVLNEGIKKYPKNYLLYYNKGVVFKDMDRVPEAVEMYKQSVLLNPYYVNGHLNLGLLAAEEGKVSQAVMALTVSLILEPNSGRSLSFLKKINDIVSSSYERKPLNLNLSPEGDDDFDEIDLILTNYAALSKDYKIPVKVDLAAIKQCYALFSQLNYDAKDKGFWMQTYVPFFKEIIKQNMFPAFTYYVLQPSANEAHIKLVKKNSSSVKQFASWVPGILDNIQTNRLITFNNKLQEVQHFYHSANHNLEIIGSYNKEKKKFSGYIEIYYNNGAIRSRGAFNDNEEKDGLWTYYDSFGNISSQVTFSKNVAEGPFKAFWPDGTLKREGTYKADKKEGVQKEYNKIGKLETVSHLENDLYEGDYRTFYRIGEEYKHYVAKYSKGNLVDTVFEYYDNGVLASKKSVEPNKSNHYSTYHRNGKLASKVMQVNSKYDGKYSKYDWFGNLEEEGVYKEGTPLGKWLTYYREQLTEESFFDEKGKKKGAIKNYDTDGKIQSEFEFANGVLLAYKYYDKNGKIIQEERNTKGDLNFVGYSPEGKKKIEGKSTSAGKKGLWKYFDEYGNLSSEENYNNKGVLTGKSRSFYKNGTVKEESIFADDSRDGLYRYYYSNGNLLQEGWYTKGNKQGYWDTYYIDGTLKTRNYYIDDNLSGYQQHFRVSGKLDYEELIKDSMLAKIIYYDNSGKEFLTSLLPNGTGKYLARYDNNRIKYELNYILGRAHGKATWFNYDGKISTEGGFHNDMRQGIWTWYHEDGKVKTKGEYLSGEKEGKWISYHPNGKIKSEDNYVNGKREGDRITYYDNGKIMVKKAFENDLDEGKALFYDPSGELQYAKIYHKGTYIAYTYYDEKGEFVTPIDVSSGNYKCVAYFKNGKKSVEYEAVNGEYQGVFQEYYFNGSILEKINFKDGDYHGVYTTYYPDGKIHHEYNYQFDDLHGLSKTFAPDGKLEKKTHYHLGSLNGPLEQYNKTGKVIKRLVYDDDDVVNQTNL